MYSVLSTSATKSSRPVSSINNITISSLPEEQKHSVRCLHLLLGVFMVQSKQPCLVVEQLHQWLEASEDVSITTWQYKWLYSTYTHEDLEVIIDHPLQTGKCSDHDNSDRKTVPETTKANVLVNTTQGTAKGFTRLAVGVQFADHDICWVRDDCTEDTGEITTSERNGSLSTLAVIVLGAWKTMVYCLHDCFERGELHHRVWNLTTPQRIETLVETTTRKLDCPSLWRIVNIPSDTFFSDDGVEASKRAIGERRDGCLHADLHCFEWTEGNVGNELSRSRCSKVKPGLVSVGILLACQVGIVLLEELVTSVFEGTLGLQPVSMLRGKRSEHATHRITEEGRAASSVDTTDTLSPANLAPGLEVPLIHLGVDLTTTFDQIKGRDSPMGHTLHRCETNSVWHWIYLRKQADRQTCKRHSTWASTAQCCRPWPAPCCWPSRTP